MISIIAYNNSSQVIKADVFNEGVDKASGEYLLFLDKNATVVEQSIEKIEPIVASSDSDLVFCQFYKEYPDGFRELVKLNPNSTNPEGILQMALTLRMSFYSCGLLIRKSFLTDHGIRWNSKLSHYAEDLLLVEILGHSPKISRISRLLSIMRIDANRDISTSEFVRRKKVEMSEFPVYYTELQSRFGKLYKTQLEDAALDFKFCCVDAGDLDLNRFNSYLPTPLHVFCRQDWTLKRKLFFIMTNFRK